MTEFFDGATTNDRKRQIGKLYTLTWVISIICANKKKKRGGGGGVLGIFGEQEVEALLP